MFQHRPTDSGTAVITGRQSRKTRQFPRQRQRRLSAAVTQLTMAGVGAALSGDELLAIAYFSAADVAATMRAGQ